jgi:hypothetical protein
MPSNPLSFTDVFGKRHSEPSVTSFVEIQVDEPSSGDLENDLIIISDFRSGAPKILKRNRSLADLANRHDPYRNEDPGVAMARISKSAFADRDVFGAADILTIRVNPATNAKLNVVAGAVDLIEIARADYGSHTNGPGAAIASGSVKGKKITLTNQVGAPFVGDNLGELVTVQYTGDASTASLSILHALGKVTYTGQVADADKVTVATATQTKVFEFDSNAAVTGGNIAVTIGADADATFANLAAAIVANLDNVAASADAANNTVLIDASEAGVALTETLDSTNKFAVVHVFPAARLKVTLAGDQTDGSADLSIALKLSGYNSIDRLANYINSQLGYTANVDPYADKFIASIGLDPVTGVNVKAAPVSLSGYNAAIVNYVNTKTRGNYIATELARGEPDDQSLNFAGGTTPPATASDWEDALNVIGADIPVGAIICPNTDDPAIFAMIAAFIEEQRTNGKWFRAFFGAAPGLTPAQYDTIAGAIDHERARLYVQRPGVFKPNEGIDYIHPVYMAAAVAGGAAGNRPFEKPLTNKRLGFAGLHPDDYFDEVTRESLLESGITVAKRENDLLVVALAVTTSRDPDRRMVRIMSEIDTVDLIDTNVRQEFQSFRGIWSSSNIDALVRGTIQRVLQQYVGTALVPGVDLNGDPVPPWRLGTPPYTIEAGLLKIAYQIFIGSEINHVSITGRATYQRIKGEVSGTLVDLSTAIPLAA